MKSILLCVLAAVSLLIIARIGYGGQAELGGTCDLSREPAIEESLRQKMLASPESRGTFLVYLREKADLGQALSINNWTERGKFVVEKLKNVAQKNQAGLLGYLESQKQSGSVEHFRAFSIVNAIQVEAALKILNDLAVRPEVLYIEEEKIYSLPHKPLIPTNGTTGDISWNISKIGADAVWSVFDVQGEDIIVANIDSGVMYTHPALVNQYRGNLGNGIFDHEYNWWDPSMTCPPGTPCDNYGHGTHTMGIMCGDDGSSNHIGVAPKAKWIACKGCGIDTCSSIDLLTCAEFILAPWDLYERNPNPAKRPHIVNNSWGDEGQECDLWYQAAVLAWRAAGIFPAFSAGNNGPQSGTVGNPGSYAATFSAGAADMNDTIYYYSSRGPSLCAAEIKPDVTAPGVDIRSSIATGGYGLGTGTSMASPHTAGCAALILSAYPSLLGDVSTVEHTLRHTAVDFGAPGPDSNFGYGRIDCFEAVKSCALRVEPVEAFSSGCPRDVQIYGFDLINETGAATTIDLTYLITAGDGLCGGPRSLGPVEHGGNVEFDVFFYSDCFGGDTVDCTISAQAGSYISKAKITNSCVSSLTGKEAEFDDNILCCELISYSDVPHGFWAEDYIYANACAGITGRYPDGTYRPALNVTRAQMSVFIIRAKYGDSFPYNETPYFSDVPAGHWAFKYIQKMYEDGITTGYADGTYRPAQNVLRSQMAAFIVRGIFGEEFTYNTTPYFTDVPASHGAFKYIQKVSEEAIAIGYSNGTYRPLQNLNRAQMAAISGKAFLKMR